jgi:hypothetical protein
MSTSNVELASRWTMEDLYERVTKEIMAIPSDTIIQRDLLIQLVSIRCALQNSMVSVARGILLDMLGHQDQLVWSWAINTLELMETDD